MNHILKIALSLLCLNNFGLQAMEKPAMVKKRKKKRTELPLVKQTLLMETYKENNSLITSIVRGLPTEFKIHHDTYEPELFRFSWKNEEPLDEKLGILENLIERYNNQLLRIRKILPYTQINKQIMNEIDAFRDKKGYPKKRVDILSLKKESVTKLITFYSAIIQALENIERRIVQGY